MRPAVPIWTAHLRAPEERGHTEPQGPSAVQGAQGWTWRLVGGGGGGPRGHTGGAGKHGLGSFRRKGRFQLDANLQFAWEMSRPRAWTSGFVCRERMRWAPLFGSLEQLVLGAARFGWRGCKHSALRTAAVLVARAWRWEERGNLSGNCGDVAARLRRPNWSNGHGMSGAGPHDGQGATRPRGRLAMRHSRGRGAAWLCAAGKSPSHCARTHMCTHCMCSDVCRSSSHGLSKCRGRALQADSLTWCPFRSRAARPVTCHLPR